MHFDSDSLTELVKTRDLLVRFKKPLDIPLQALIDRETSAGDKDASRRLRTELLVMDGAFKTAESEQDLTAYVNQSVVLIDHGTPEVKEAKVNWFVLDSIYNSKWGMSFNNNVLDDGRIIADQSYFIKYWFRVAKSDTDLNMRFILFPKYRAIRGEFKNKEEFDKAVLEKISEFTDIKMSDLKTLGAENIEMFSIPKNTDNDAIKEIKDCSLKQ